MKGALAVFVKTPELSPVKTRLAAQVGKAAAVAVYDEFLKLSAKMMRDIQTADSEISPFWAVGEEVGVNSKRWCDFPAMYTGAGGLGKRLNHIYATLQKKYGRVALVGSDCPQLQAASVLDSLQQARGKAVIGPASDGGFYLFAAARRITATSWTTVSYSQDDTLKQLLKNLQGMQTSFLEPLCDVDDLASLKAAIAVMKKEPSLQQPAEKLAAVLYSLST